MRKSADYHVDSGGLFPAVVAQRRFAHADEFRRRRETPPRMLRPPSRPRRFQSLQIRRKQFRKHQFALQLGRQIQRPEASGQPELLALLALLDVVLAESFIQQPVASASPSAPAPLGCGGSAGTRQGGRR